MNYLLYLYNLFFKSTLPINEYDYLQRDPISIIIILYLLFWLEGIDPVVIKEIIPYLTPKKPLELIYPILVPNEYLCPEIIEDTKHQGVITITPELFNYLIQWIRQ